LVILGFITFSTVLMTGYAKDTKFTNPTRS
jgi:hypothetical protein